MAYVLPDGFTRLTTIIPANDLYTDSDAVFSIVGRKINIGNYFAYVGDDNSQIVTFELDRYCEGIDLIDKVFEIKYSRLDKTNGTANGSYGLVNFIYSDTKIRFSWLLDSFSTLESGVLKFVLKIIGNVGSLSYESKTETATLTIVSTLATETNQDSENLNLGDVIYYGNDTPASTTKIWIKGTGVFIKNTSNAWVNINTLSGGGSGTTISSVTINGSNHLIITMSDASIIDAGLINTGIPTSYLSTDGTLTSNSDVKVPSEKAVKTYADTKLNKTSADTYYETKNTNIQSHITNTSNPHSVTKAQVGLGNVPNTDTSTTTNITDSTNKRFVTDVEKTKITNAITDVSAKLEVVNIKAGTGITLDKVGNDVTINSTAVGSASNSNATVAIIGDSYSTYSGWLPSGYAAWYKSTGNEETNDVADVTDTWWWKLCNEMPLNLLKNVSYSGSTICNTGYAGDSTATSFITRIKVDLGETLTTSVKPNIILVFGGTNDDWAGSPIGALQYSGWTTESLFQVLPAFCYLMSYLKKYNPGTKIYNIVNEGMDSAIASGMATACTYYNVPNIVLTGIDKQNFHPSKLGMTQIKNQVKTALSLAPVATVAVASIALNLSSLTGLIGGQGSLQTTILPNDATDKTVSWSTSNSAVATVSNGVVTYIGVGSATITATTSNGLTATCSVTVQVASGTTVFSDTFTRADSNVTVGNAETGQAWTPVVSTWGIVSGKVKPISAVDFAMGGTLFADTGLADFDLSADFTFNTYSCIEFRYTGIDNNYRLRLSSSGFGLFKIVNYATTSLGSYVVTPVAGTTYNMRVVAQGTSIKCYLDDVLVIDITDNTYTTQTKIALYSGASNLSDTCDNVIVKSL